MGRHWYRLCLLSALFLLLTGCFFKAPDDLYAVPKAPEDFQNLQAKIDEVLHAGAEYAAPVTGSYTQTVQLRDLDGDGIQEAIAFFRMTAATDTGKPLKIYIFRQGPDDLFQVQTIIECNGSAINSIAYEDLGGDSAKELVISWQIYGIKTYELMAYSIHGDVAEEILREPYTDYAVLDLDKDNHKEIIILDLMTETGVGQADFFDYDEAQGRMLLQDSAPLSKEILSLNETRPRVSGLLKDNEPALFVTSNMVAGIVTDILAWRDGHLVNITLDQSTGISTETYRLNTGVGLRDINRDSIMELPRPMAFPAPKLAEEGSVDFWSVQWMQYDLQGTATPVYTTYYNGEDGWYLILPDAWSTMINPQGQGQKVTVSRRDVAGSGERGVVFSLWDGSESSQSVPFLVIYKLTGPNRESRSKLGDRFVLTRENDAVYAAELLAGAWDCGLTAETLPSHFCLIQPD